ncbi:hypothetical protein RchiOBHm_Chr5g0066831 [Rosa chinensis]|uniref:Uncharacterized protein n=1 Tax=Rosa chinensis TaxID=74649 RepID=A0A2P6QJA7_ROSCH|nr:hypothetical protein RchiOBHm_Chr5g0066831 [Rosa chinensis]
MDSRHASLGRRTLEEIRQKRAAERLSKTSSGPDLSQIPPIDNGGMRKSESANRLSESDVSTLVSQIRDLDRKNVELEEQNKNLASMLETKEAVAPVYFVCCNLGAKYCTVFEESSQGCRNGERCCSCCTGGSLCPAAYAQETS